MNIHYQDNIEKIVLPKWPAMVVMGDPITPLQAAEILIRTDTHLPDFEYAGNDKIYAQQMSDIFDITFPKKPDTYFWENMDALRDKLKIIPLEYLNNSRIISAWVGGPRGWCNWNGQIFCDNYNIGKWPDVEIIARDWSQISQAFPFLKLTCVLYNGETCEYDKTAVVQYDVSGGQVTVKRPDPNLIIAQPRDDEFDAADFVLNHVYSNRGERGIAVEQLKNKVIQIYGDNYPKMAK